ncbi:MAG: diguanylate cyclase [Parcubacteria group bacterium]|jgi:diguanylate cyclase (GGDEF)-like protein
MGLRSKIAVMIMGFLVVFIAASHMLLNAIFQPAIIVHENEHVETNVRRITEVFQNEMKHLDQMCADWSSWDASYAFMVSRDQKYIDENIDDSTFTNAKLNLLHFVDMEHQTIFSRVYDYVQKREIDIDEFSRDMVNVDRFLIPRTHDDRALVDQYVSGVVATSRGMMIVSSRFILTSQNQGPARGVLIMGRFIEPMIDRIKKQIDIDFDVIVDYDRFYTQEQLRAHPYMVKKEGDEMFSVYQGVQDIRGDIAFVVHFFIPRTYYTDSMRLLKYAHVSIAVFALVNFFSVLCILEILCFRPLLRLKKSIEYARENREFTTHITVKSQDEIGSLTRSFSALCQVIARNNADLERLAQTDILTGVANRRFLEKFLCAEIQRSQRRSLIFSVLFFDIDHFKQINDEYGHLCGDHVLQKFAQLLQENSRKEDLVVRYGGEEFVIVLPDTHKDDALQHAERLRQLIANASIAWGDRTIVITSSVGCASYPQNGDTAERVVSAADNALYAAKDRGRNRVVVA